MKDKESLIRLIKENRVIVASVAVLIVASVTYVIIFAPLINRLGAKYKEYRLYNDRIVDALNLIEYARGINASFGSRILISEKDAAKGLEEFVRHGKSIGINFISIKPSEIIVKQNTPYKILPVELDIESTGEQFVDFMGSIDELKKAIVTVNSFEVTPDKQNPKRINANVVVNIYLSASDSPVQ